MNLPIIKKIDNEGDGGDISVSFEEDSKEKRLLIEDSGIGIKSEDIQRVFEKGFVA